MESQENDAQEPSTLTFCSIVKVEEEVKEELEDFDYPFCDPELSDGHEEMPGTSKSADNSQSQEFWKTLLQNVNENAFEVKIQSGFEVKVEPQSSSNETSDSGSETNQSFIESGKSNDSDWAEAALPNKDKITKKKSSNSYPTKKSSVSPPIPVRSAYQPKKPVLNREQRADKAESGRFLDAFQKIASSLFPIKDSWKDSSIDKDSSVENDSEGNIELQVGSEKDPLESVEASVQETCSDVQQQEKKSKSEKTLKKKPKTIPNCLFCGEMFKNLRGLKLHWLQFRAYQCGTCFLTFDSLYCCTKHINQVHNGEAVGKFGIFKAVEPYSDFSNKKTEKESWFQCKSCKVILETEFSVVDHVKRIHKNVYEKFNGLDVILKRGGIEKNVAVWSSKMEFKKAAVKIKRLDLENTSDPLFITSPDETSSTDVKCELCSKSFGEEILYKKHLQKVHKIKNSAIMRIDPDNGDNNEEFVAKKKRGTQRFEYEPDIGSLMEIKKEREDEQSSKQSSNSDFSFLSLNAVKSKVNSPPDSRNVGDEEPLGLFELGSLFQSSSTTFHEESSDDEPSLGFSIQDIIAASSPSTSYAGIKYPCPYCNNVLANQMNLMRHIRGNHVGVETLMKSIGASVSKVVQKPESLRSLRLKYNVGPAPSTQENDVELNRLPSTSQFGQHRTRANNAIPNLALSVVGNNRKPKPVKRRRENIPTVPVEELNLNSLLTFRVPTLSSPMEESPSQ